MTAAIYGSVKTMTSPVAECGRDSGAVDRCQVLLLPPQLGEVVGHRVWNLEPIESCS